MEEKETNQQQESLHLQKAYTFFIIPFYYEGDHSVSQNGGDSLWELSKGKLLGEGDDILYPYIINFLQGQVGAPKGVCNHLDVYNISSNSQSKRRKFWDCFSQKPDNSDENPPNKDKTGQHFADLEIGKDKDNKKIYKRVVFDIVRDNGYTGFKSPHLFVSPTANIGILTFCISLGKKNRTIGDLKLFNYYLHKISKPLSKCGTPCFQLEKQDAPNEGIRIKRENRITDFRQCLAPHDNTIDTWSPYDEFNWNIHTLIEMLLADFKAVKKEEEQEKECGAKLFNNIRAHLFSFCQIDGIQYPVGYEDIKSDLMLLSRCFNDKYMICVDEATEKNMCINTFRNIYFASSIEGASMIAIAKEENNDFIKQMDNQSLPRYLAIYLLVIIQRYSMLHINQQLTEIEAEETDSNLWSLLEIIKKVKVHCYYTDVSPYSQHNQFYQHCCKNLHIREIFNEIDNKTKILNVTISHSMQVLMEQQKQELEKQREEEAIREKGNLMAEKEREEEQRKTEKKAESGQRRLNLVVGILTAFQVSQVIYSFASDSTISLFGGHCIEWAVLTLIVCFALLYIVMNWESTGNSLIRWVRKIYYHKHEIE